MSVSAVAVVEHEAGVSLANINDLVGWVMQAPVEEVCWRITEIGSLRGWVQAQKEATELRRRAVRLEMIALRKVAQGGLATKIAGGPQNKAAATWLATLTDAEFARVLDEIDGERTPVALYRADKLERDAMAAELKRNDREHPAPFSGNPVDSDDRVRYAAETILREVIEDGETFTIAEAASRVADRLGLDSVIREETAQGIAEMVRAAIRRGSRTTAVDQFSVLPVAFTVADPDGHYVRVPASSASVGHLQAHASEVRKRAEETMRRAEELEEVVSRIYAIAELDGGIDEEELMGMRLAPFVARFKGGAVIA